MMKKGYYVHFQGRESIGVSKKIDMQMEELEKSYEMTEVEIGAPQRSLLRRLIGLWPTASILRDYEAGLRQIQNPDFLYIRRTVADKAYVGFLREIRRRYPKCRIIIEIFTYPYDKDDFGKWNAWPFYLKERLYRPRLKKYVDRFVTYTQDQEIFGVPTIPAANGICVEKVKVVRGQFEKGRIRLIAVAFMQRHHGYERLLEGLAGYYREGEGEYRVELSLVGDGPEKSFYQELSEKYQLSEYVHFYPTVSGEELDELYNHSDIALTSFGMYKLGMYGKVSVLKSRECMAKGMLMLSGCEIDVLGEDYPFVLNFPNDKTPVDICRVASFYQQIVQQHPDKEKLAADIRRIAKEKVSMEAVMRPVVRYIEQGQR